ncbi:hypothetical protein AB0H83_14895 [Dactylosporangium sp. NPDC050688]|uniref:hypothetical protein n=1 Tax=Dactylosporangium sp. NPDC050688 TaxID=3157217 RepID=UPI003408577C
MLFDPAANLLAAQPHGGDVRVIAGEVPVGQLCRDPEAFADVTTLVAPNAPGAPPLDARARALLSLVWPTSAAQARQIWGARIAARIRPLLGTATIEDLPGHLDDLVPSLIADVVGIPASALRRVESRSALTASSCPDAVTRAAAPLALLHTAVAAAVRDRAAATAAPPDHPETVLDDALFWRGLGRDHVSLDEIAALVSALTAAAWDATRTTLPRLLDTMTATTATRPAPAAAGTTGNAGSKRATADRPAWAGLVDGAAERATLVDTAVRCDPPVIGWLRITTAEVQVDGATIPAGTRCLWLVDATDPADRRTPAALRALRWLSPGAPDGAGATFARLVGDALLTATAATRPHRSRWYLPDTATA